MKRNIERLNRFSAVLGLVGAFAMIGTSAWAVIIPIPEPATTGLFAAGVATAYVIRRLTRRK